MSFGSGLDMESKSELYIKVSPMIIELYCAGAGGAGAQAEMKATSI